MSMSGPWLERWLRVKALARYPCIIPALEGRGGSWDLSSQPHGLSVRSEFTETCSHKNKVASHSGLCSTCTATRARCIHHTYRAYTSKTAGAGRRWHILDIQVPQYQPHTTNSSPGRSSQSLAQAWPLLDVCNLVNKN